MQNQGNICTSKTVRVRNMNGLIFATNSFPSTGNRKYAQKTNYPSKQKLHICYDVAPDIRYHFIVRSEMWHTINNALLLLLLMLLLSALTGPMTGLVVAVQQVCPLLLMLLLDAYMAISAKMFSMWADVEDRYSYSSLRWFLYHLRCYQARLPFSATLIEQLVP